jgi:hypothetical protein
MRVRLSLLMLLFGFPLFTFGQSGDPHPIVENFILFENGGDIHVRWDIKGGSTCDGIRIQRASNDDTLNFTQVGSIEGICGNANFAIPYEFIDENPVANATNHYRLELGAQGTSSFISLYYAQLGESGYTAFPNPITTQATIFFDNPDQKTYILVMHDMSGKVVKITPETQKESITIDRAGLMKGLYIFTLYNEENEKITGKLVVD